MAAYLSNYEQGWEQSHPGIRMTETSMDKFKDWLDSSNRKMKPFAEYRGNQTVDMGLNYQLSDELDENGRPFILNSNGSIVFGRIESETGLTQAPILLSEGIITNEETDAGYGLVHIEARHGKDIRKTGYKSVLDFIEHVANNWTSIREGVTRNGNKTYRLIATDSHNNTLMIELSGDGSYWNINTAGVFKTSYGRNNKEIYSRHTTANQSTETDEESQDSEQSGTTESSRMNTPISIGKGSTMSAENQTSGAENQQGGATASEGNGRSYSISERQRGQSRQPKPSRSAKEVSKGVADFARAMGREVTYDGDFRDSNERGYVEDGVIHINPKMDEVEQAAFVLGHEFTHTIEGGEAYDNLVEFIKGSALLKQFLSERTKEMREDGSWKHKRDITFEELAEYTQRLYGRNGVEIDSTEAESEVVADFVSKNILSNDARLREFMADAPGARNIFRRVLDAIAKFIKRFSGNYRELEALSERLRNATEATQEWTREDGKRKYYIGKKRGGRNAKEIFEAARDLVASTGIPVHEVSNEQADNMAALADHLHKKTS